MMGSYLEYNWYSEACVKKGALEGNTVVRVQHKTVTEQ